MSRAVLLKVLIHKADLFYHPSMPLHSSVLPSISSVVIHPVLDRPSAEQDYFESAWGHATVQVQRCVDGFPVPRSE